MQEVGTTAVTFPSTSRDVLTDVFREGAQQMLAAAIDSFVAAYGAKYPKACACLSKDRDELLTFYDFPAEHWRHLRTTNPIESVFATVRLRHRRTKGNGSRRDCLAMVHQLMLSAGKRWRLLNGSSLLPDAIAGIPFPNGLKPQETAA